MWAFTIFAPPTAERSPAVSRSKHGDTDIFEERSLAGEAKIVNAHIRRFPVSKAQGEGIPHGAMPTVPYSYKTSDIITRQAGDF